MGLQYRPLTDSFRELNRMLTEKQAWDAEHKLREGEQGIKNLMATSQLESTRQQQEMNAYKLQEMERDNTPTTFNLWSITQGGQSQRDDIMKSPEAIDQILRTVYDGDPKDYKFNAGDGSFEDKFGNKLQISRNELRYRAPGVFGAIDAHTDFVSGTSKNIGVLKDQISTLQDEIKKGRESKAGPVGMAQQYRRLDELKANLKKQSEALDPEDLHRYYMDIADRQTKRAAFYNSMGATELANQMQRNSELAYSTANGILQKQVERGYIIEDADTEYGRKKILLGTYKQKAADIAEQNRLDRESKERMSKDDLIAANAKAAKSGSLAYKRTDGEDYIFASHRLASGVTGGESDELKGERDWALAAYDKQIAAFQEKNPDANVPYAEIAQNVIDNKKNLINNIRQIRSNLSGSKGGNRDNFIEVVRSVQELSKEEAKALKEAKPEVYKQMVADFKAHQEAEFYNALAKMAPGVVPFDINEEYYRELDMKNKRGNRR